jgi:hypothetical protein
MKKGKFWNVFGKLGVQTIPVIIGVYLGLIANEFSQNRKEKQRTIIMKERLLDEIDTNHDYLSKVINYHKFLVDTSNAMLYQYNFDNWQKPTFWEGFKTKRLNESAYQATLLTGTLANFEIDELEVISEIYTEQVNYNEFISHSISNLSNKNLSDKEGLREILAFINSSATDIYYLEKGLIEYYEQAKSILTIKD